MPESRAPDGRRVAAQILIVDDETAIRQMLSFALAGDGYACSEAGDIDEAQQAVATRRPDLILLDWMLPGISGVDYARRLKRDPRTGDIPIILLTAKGEEADKVKGLDSGADDYVTKPFSPAELVARVRAVLRRARPSTAEEALDYAGIRMDLAAHRVARNGRAIHLGPTEFRLLRHFLEHPGRVFAREQLLDAVWGHDVYVEPRTVDVHIRRLRKAINAEGEPDVIRTVRSAGYALDVDEA